MNDMQLGGAAQWFVSVVVVLAISVFGYFVRSRPTTNTEFGWPAVCLFLLTLLVFGPFAYKHWSWFRQVYDSTEVSVLPESWQVEGGTTSGSKKLPSPKGYIVVDRDSDPPTVAPDDGKEAPKGCRLAIKVGDKETEFLTGQVEVNPPDAKVLVSWYKDGKHLRKTQVLP